MAALLVGLLGAAVVLWILVVQRRRLRRVVGRIRGWLTGESAERLEVTGGGPWAELAVAVNALGASLEEERREVEEYVPWRRDVVDALTSPALLFSGDGELVAANRAAREVLTIPDRPEVSIVEAVGSASVAEAADEARRSGYPVSLDVEIAGRELRVRVAPVGSELLVVATDRTRERRVEDLRRNFVSNASHELKTPATAIQTLAEALRVAVDGDPDRARRLVDRLGEEAERLTRMVHDLLDLRRLEDPGPLERVPVDLAEVVREVVAELAPRAEGRGVELQVEVPERAQLAGVPDDVGLIVRNLVTNAIQYNREDGHVRVSVSPTDGAHELTVTDTGLGIPHQDLQRIFERFYRVDLDRSRESGGTGLGLSLVRHAVERQGGRIQVDSLLGEGSTFVVVLPVDPTEPPAA